VPITRTYRYEERGEIDMGQDVDIDDWADEDAEAWAEWYVG
jgi:hypothetical protein